MMSKELEDQLLVTLSYFESMSLELILIDMDSEFLKKNHSLTTADLELALKNLTKKKLIKIDHSNDQKKWLRVYQKKSVIKRYLSYLNFIKK